MRRYFLFAAEMSGDLHGSRLMEALRAQEANPELCGVGGSRMRQQGLDCFFQMESFQVMGLSDVLKSLPSLCQLFYAVRNKILQIEPDGVILIDYPGFHLRLARALRKQGFKGKLIQYICPTVWAHGKRRIDLLANHYDLLLTIYPFEAAYFAPSSLKVEYIGHPLTETIHTHVYDPDWSARLGLPTHKEWIALFPGSREGEVLRHTRQQLHVAAKLKKHYPHLCFALSCAQEGLHASLLEVIKQGSLHLNEDLYLIPPGYNYELMKHCKAALAKSGTVTLELALHCVPTVVHYELSRLDHFFAKYILRLQLPHYCIVNLLHGQTIFPEFMGRGLSSTDLTLELRALYSNASRREQVITACEDVKLQLGKKFPHQCAAMAIQELIKC